MKNHLSGDISKELLEYHYDKIMKSNHLECPNLKVLCKICFNECLKKDVIEHKCLAKVIAKYYKERDSSNQKLSN